MMRKLCTPSTVTNHNPLYNTTNPDASVTELSTDQTTAADDDDDVTTNPDVRASFESLTSGCVSIGSLGDSLPEVKSCMSDRERGENLTSHKLCSHDQDSLLYEGVEFKAFDTWEEHTGDGLLDDVMKCVFAHEFCDTQKWFEAPSLRPHLPLPLPHQATLCCLGTRANANERVLNFGRFVMSKLATSQSFFAF